jgi:hypothetical protein
LSAGCFFPRQLALRPAYYWRLACLSRPGGRRSAARREKDCALRCGSVWYPKSNKREGGVIVAMRKPWRIIVGFAVLGLAITAVVYAYYVFYDYIKPTNTIDFAFRIASFGLCPPTLLLAMCIDCEASGWNGVYIFSILGLLNAALYAIIGAVVVRQWKKSN